MNTETNKSRKQIGSRVQFWQRQEKVNKEFVVRVRHIYSLLGQANKAIRILNERLLRLAGYSSTSRKIIEAMGKQSHAEIAKMKAELYVINQRLEELQKKMDTIYGGSAPFSPNMQSYLIYAAIFLSILSMGLSIWCIFGR